MNELKEIFESKILLTESKNPYIIGHLTCDAAEGEIATKNNNTYSTALLKRESGALNKRIEKSGVLGCLEHPPTFNSPLNKASHIITKSKMKGNRMEIETAVLNTPPGKAFWAILNSGIKSIGASIRGAGTRGYDGKIKDDYRLSSIDFVSAPAAECATIDASNIIESYVPTSLDEAFFSLRDNLSTAIKKEFGKEHWLVDFSNKEAVFRKDGDTEEQYKKISYKIKGNEIELTGDSKTVERKIQYEEEKMGKEAILLRKFEEAVVSGFQGSFEDYKEMNEKHKPGFDALMAHSESVLKKIDEASKPKELSPEELALRRRYYEAQFTGFTGSFKDWKDVMKKGEEKDLMEAALARPTVFEKLSEVAEHTRREILEELPRKEQLKLYIEEKEKGEFEGTFVEWLQLKEKEEKEYLKKELKALEELSS